MWPESEIQNCKNIFLDETLCFCQNDEAEKAFNETLEKIKNIFVFSELHEKRDEVYEKLGIPDELKAVLENADIDPFLSHEEYFRKCMRLVKEFYHIEQKAH